METDLTCQARTCDLVTQATRLTDWIGAGRPVTPKGVLKPTDAVAAANVLGLTLPARIRTAADVPALHRPWLVAVETGLVSLDRGWATPADPPDLDWPTRWLAALNAVLRSESRDAKRQGGAAICAAVLTTLATEGLSRHCCLETAVARQLHSGDTNLLMAAYQAFGPGKNRATTVRDLLREFGATDPAGALTALGEWAYARFSAGTPKVITPELPAATVLELLAHRPVGDPLARISPWLATRSMTQVAAELLNAAEHASPAERVIAVDIAENLDDPVLEVWQDMVDRPNLTAHAQQVLAGLGVGDGPDEAGRQWLVTEHALFLLAADSAAEAHRYLRERGGLEAIAYGHPGAAGLRDELTRLLAAGGGQDQVYQLKIELPRERPAVWRRIRLADAATLRTLHQVIQVAFNWSGDHLHAFEAQGEQYSDPLFELDSTSPEDATRVLAALPEPGATMTYIYDMGDWWEHRITLEQILPPDPSSTSPICVAGAGAAPVEDWNPQFPADPTPFDQDAINQALAGAPRAD